MESYFLEKIIARVLDIDHRIITDETSPMTVANWDSFNGLLLVTELEKNFNVSFDIEEVANVKNVGDIKRVLQIHGINV